MLKIKRKKGDCIPLQTTDSIDTESFDDYFGEA